MEKINSSKFHMWRGCIACIYLDGKVSDEERRFALERMQNLPLTPEQRKTIESDFINGCKIENFLPHITEKADRAFLLHQLRVISHLDGFFSPEEKKAYAELEQKILSNIDLKKAKAEVESIEIESYHENKVFETYNKSSIFEAAVNNFQKMVNKGDYKFPKR